MVQAGIPLSEVMKWDLQDIDDFNAVADMKQDYQSAHSMFMQERSENRK